MKKDKEKLSGDYVAGFVDGEGCFALKFRRDRKQNSGNKKIRKYFYWGVEFVIVLKSNDLNVLKLIKNTLGCGMINSAAGGKEVRFSIQNAKDLQEKIVPFFKKHKLHAKKAADFKLWVKAVGILNKYRDGSLNIQIGHKGFTKKNIKKEDLRQLYGIRVKMLDYKSERKKDFKWGTRI